MFNHFRVLTDRRSAACANLAQRLRRLGLRDSNTTRNGTAEARPLQRLVRRRARLAPHRRHGQPDTSKVFVWRMSSASPSASKYRPYQSSLTSSWSDIGAGVPVAHPTETSTMKRDRASTQLRRLTDRCSAAATNPDRFRRSHLMSNIVSGSTSRPLLMTRSQSCAAAANVSPAQASTVGAILFMCLAFLDG